MQHWALIAMQCALITALKTVSEVPEVDPGAGGTCPEVAWPGSGTADSAAASGTVPGTSGSVQETPGNLKIDHKRQVKSGAARRWKPQSAT